MIRAAMAGIGPQHGHALCRGVKLPHACANMKAAADSVPAAFVLHVRAERPRRAAYCVATGHPAPVQAIRPCSVGATVPCAAT